MNSVLHGFPDIKPPLSGKVLAEKLKRMRPGARAVLALSLTGDVPVIGFSRAQAARLAEVSAHAVAIAGLATADERAALMRGSITLADVRLAHAHTPDEMRESQVMAIFDYVGIERAWAVLDRMTAPVAAE